MLKSCSVKSTVNQIRDQEDNLERKHLHYNFGELIRDRRKSLKMTQEELAKRIGKKRPYISRMT